MSWRAFIVSLTGVLGLEAVNLEEIDGIQIQALQTIQQVNYLRLEFLFRKELT